MISGNMIHNLFNYFLIKINLLCYNLGKFKKSSIECELISKYIWSRSKCQIEYDKQPSIFSLFGVLVVFILNFKFVY